MTGNTNTTTNFRNLVLHGDSIALIRAMPRGTVGFILADLPYLVNYQGRNGRRGRMTRTPHGFVSRSTRDAPGFERW
ncbi:hypothetical protein LV478_09480 [Komagataeibacter oboediens]|uniref:hypothetical protein n=1 Tax=Komagataeibacter oboediens TaxID=65958 RepID=UPI0023DB6342|nr:hypothetical protein [Komagataeibacter oboediens]WEQ53689.1 hypothetical protein LV478_09480 [Komagataeibacter oboediens]